MSRHLATLYKTKLQIKQYKEKRIKPLNRITIIVTSKKCCSVNPQEKKWEIFINDDLNETATGSKSADYIDDDDLVLNIAVYF